MTAALVRDANRVSPPKQGDRAGTGNTRGLRYRMRDGAGRALRGQRVETCGRKAVGPVVEVCQGDGAAHFSGIETCGSVWHCPVCAAHIAEERRQEVEAVIQAHLARGGAVYMATFTVPHDRFQTCQELRVKVREAWGGLHNGSPWLRWKKRCRITGFVRALEVTHGGNGWHPHIHALYFVPAGVDEVTAQEFGIFLFERWARRVEKLDLGQCNPALWRFERTAQTERAGEYVTKWGADRELTQGHTKLAKGGGRSPWQLIIDMMRGDKHARLLFREYAYAFKGARQLTWSRGLREEYGLRGREDDEIAADPEPRARVVGSLSNRAFKRVAERGLAADLLEAVEATPHWSTIAIFLRKHGIEQHGPPNSPGTGASGSSDTGIAGRAVTRQGANGRRGGQGVA